MIRPVPDATFPGGGRPLVTRLLGLATGLAIASAAFAAPAPTPEPAPPPADLEWLNRVTFGVDSASLARFEKLGRKRFLDEQLSGRNDALPALIAQQVEVLDVTRLSPTAVMAETVAENQRIKAIPEGDEKQAARKALNERGNQFAYQAARVELLRAVYSPAQLKEQMTWFWLNHFSVFQYKANLRWLVGDYAEHAIRPHALGHFRDLVMATLTHPAMLEYLDNAQNANGHINENYARELMELHTLGVDAGYTQADVQQLAHILTGIGVNFADDKTPKLKPEWQALYRRAGNFEFNPARHDFSDKTLLGHAIRGAGFAEVEQAVDLIIRQPACAKFISRELATYFVADAPPPALVDRMAKTFQRTNGDIAAVLRTLFESRELTQSLGKKFKDPMQFVVASIRLAYDGRPIANTHPLVNWLNGLGEPLFGRLTPDGYALTEAAWTGTGQLSRRFDIARAIASGNAGLFDPEDGSSATTTGFPQLSSRLYYAAIEPRLSAPVREALDRANSQQEWNTFLLASPDANYR
ncbi:DUF1800 domain-containing protein [Dokdonella soli]